VDSYISHGLYAGGTTCATVENLEIFSGCASENSSAKSLYFSAPVKTLVQNLKTKKIGKNNFGLKILYFQCII